MISVITPVYNGEKFIEGCIKVVIDQKCPNIEHIIIDGGSTDKTVSIIKNYAENYPHIRWISENDKGQSDAMNKGILTAKGEIIGILNVDDFYNFNVLNRILEIFKDLPESSFVVGNCNVLNEEDVIQYVNKPKELNIIPLLLNKVPHPFNPSAYFYHKKLHEVIGLYDINEHYVMDLDFIFKAVQGAIQVKYVDETWGNYRSIQGTKTNLSKASGQHIQLAKYIRKKHIRKLPLLQQCQVAVESSYLYKAIRKVVKIFKSSPNY
ncbi:glycosyl transferase [Nostoc minutum NIES-26]|uniref:Glycosyl transferase n=1 Tax=Nostoc minutum NIES-26 TaxID=1844469 RepID=A0A367QNH9_9NOSO|nr:glycosyl transferase [Nostoc minutum NIES-26]